MVETQDIGEAMTSAREALGLTQAKMVKLYNNTEPIALHITRGNLAKYETNTADPPTTKWLKFQAIFKEEAEKRIRALQRM